MRHLTLRNLVFGAMFSLLLSVLPAHSVGAAYNGGRIIDNSIFLNAQSMSVNDIQNFLVGKNAGISRMNFPFNCYAADSQERRWYTAIGAPCDQTVPASQIIYYVAQVYGINPQVILATLQKEQSLTTAVDPTIWQISQAMGYGCPTTGSCSDTSNFFYQVDNGTWLLRFHYERANGNMDWWYNSSTWVCGGPTNFYKPSLKPGQNVDFYDEDGVLYRTLWIENAATSSLYCYTPHTYNNPQGLYGRDPYGSVGRYYSGSYNFVYFFELWFGSTLIPDYSAKPVDQTPYPVIFQGESQTAKTRFQNLGNAPWYDDFTAWNAGKPPVKLGTDGPLNRASAFGSKWRWGSTRAADTFSKVYEADGVTLSPDQHIVRPGQIGEFTFEFTVPGSLAVGYYKESFRLIVEGWGAMKGDSTWWGVSVDKPNYTAQAAGQSYYPVLVQGESAPAYFRYKNSGNVPWYDDFTAWNAGKPPVKLGTDGPLNRASVFGSKWRWGSTRAADTFSKVYEADGVTLSPDQHIVRPGQIGEFKFDFTSTARTEPGFYNETFRPIVEGVGPMNYIGTWLGVTVKAANYTAKPVGQSYYPTIPQGGSAPAYFSFQNLGNTPWYDDFTAWNAGKPPVKLGTDNSINRASAFGSKWRWGATRAADTFGAVYEADGVTLSQNQHIVYPGQIGRLEFSFTASPAQAPGFYPEAFLPIVEGLTAMNMYGGHPWLGVTVTR